MASLYLHIPFCAKKCHYCAFVSFDTYEDLFKPYIDALKKELSISARSASDRKLESLFIGGGTPTILPRESLAELIEYTLNIFSPDSAIEISVEANPGTVDKTYLKTLIAAGVNRLSLGVQSFNDTELLMLGRTHTSKDAKLAIEAARNAGFANLNLDLMYGIPCQTTQSWHATLQTTLTYGPEHLSLYQLTLEKNTQLNERFVTSKNDFPNEAAILKMDAMTSKYTAYAGLLQYEISNYATLGYECFHNVNYWKNGDYYACGAAAVSCLRGVRERRVSNVKEYIRRIQADESCVIDSETLDNACSFRESVVMGLRMTSGVSKKSLAERYGIDVDGYYGTTLKKLLSLGLLESTETHLKLTKKGLPIANWIMSELV